MLWPGQGGHPQTGSRPSGNWMMSGGGFPLESFCGTICLCDTVNAEVQVCGQEDVLPERCVSEDIGMVFSKHFSLLFPDFKKRRQENGAPHSVFTGHTGGVSRLQPPPVSQSYCFLGQPCPMEKPIKLLSPGKEDEKTHVTTEMPHYLKRGLERTERCLGAVTPPQRGGGDCQVWSRLTRRDGE